MIVAQLWTLNESHLLRLYFGVFQPSVVIVIVIVYYQSELFLKVLFPYLLSFNLPAHPQSSVGDTPLHIAAFRLKKYLMFFKVGGRRQEQDQVNNADSAIIFLINHCND